MNADYFFPENQSAEERAQLPYMCTLSELLSFCSDKYGDKTAFIEGPRRFSYSDISNWVESKRHLFDELHISPGCNIGIECTSSMDTRLWFLAICTLGRVAVMIPPLQDDSELSSFVEQFDLRAIITDDELFSISTDSKDESSALNITGETPAAIFFTGGSTGSPKGVMLSHQSIMRGSLNSTYFNCGELFNSITISLLPLHHIYGTVAGFLAHLYKGAKIYFFKDIATSVSQIPIIRPTALYLVPALVEMLINISRVKGDDFLGDLKSIGCGGAPISQEYITLLKSHGINIYHGYGMTEIGGTCTVNMNSAKRPHSVGLPCPGTDIKLVNDELWIKSDGIMLGYYMNPEETSEKIEDGWLKTGDLASIDEDGYITIIGRVNNMIVLPNGENIHPEVIEERLLNSPLVKSCIVKTIEENKRILLAAEIYPDMDNFSDSTAEDLKDVVFDINATLPDYANIMKIIIRTEDFPKTASMKIDRKAALE